MDSLRLPARLESLEALRLFVLHHAEAMGLAPQQTMKLELVLEEVLVNVMNYAYPAAPGDVDVGVERQGGMLLVTVRDWGKPFNPLEQPAPDLSVPLNERHIGGLGIVFLREMTNALEYEYEQGANALTMGFALQPQNSEDNQADEPGQR